jgi:4-hydroxy-tetrahydrodipicolinate synthase
LWVRARLPAGADAVMMLPESYWKLSESETFQHFLSICDAVGIPIMMYNNQATSGVDMSPKLLVRIFHTSDNVSMVKENTGNLSRMQRIDQLGGCRSTTAAIRWCWTPCGCAPRVGARPWPCLRPQPCIGLYGAVRVGEMQRAQTIYTELQPLLEYIVAGGLATTVKADLEFLGAGVGDPRRPSLPLDDEGRAALQKLLTII